VTARRAVMRRQVSLYVHLSRIVWTLASRIAWAKISDEEAVRIMEVQPMLERAAFKSRSAIRSRHGGSRP